MRHAAWRAAGRLEALIDDILFGAGRECAVAHLESAVEDATQAIDDIRSCQREAEHYEQGNRA